MKKLFTLILLVQIAFLLSSCKKEGNDAPSKKVNVKSTTTSGLSFYYKYDDENKLTQTILDYVNGTLTTDYTYLNGKINTIKPSINITPYKSYSYNSSGLLTEILQLENFATNNNLYSTSHLTYNADGKLAQMNVTDFESRDRGKFMYQYNVDGLLSKIIVVNSGEITIESYSDECDFNPYVITDMVNIRDLLPELLIGAKRLPAKYSYKFNDGSVLHGEFSYVIKDREIQNLTSNYIQTFEYQGDLITSNFNATYKFNY